jgi:SAM-dependent methyltransferase
MPSDRQPRPAWRLPPGISRGAWEYFQSAVIADDYDCYFSHNSLFDFDQQVLAKHFSPPGWVADLGCGTGRALVPLVRAGHRGLAIDMSQHMLRVVRGKACADGLAISCLRANLVELDAVQDHAMDYAICLFSTLGMIRGRDNRRLFLKHASRIVRPDGCFVLHVHNFWFNLRDPGGPWWVVKNLATAPFCRDLEVGDKWFAYRGLSNMFLHVFRWSELAADLRATGWRIQQRISLNVQRRDALWQPWLLGSLRANGWIVVCRPAKPS